MRTRDWSSDVCSSDLPGRPMTANTDPPGSPLVWWRCRGPSQLAARRHVLLNWLVARTAAPDLQRRVGHALAGETAAGIRIAAELYDAHPDLTGSWLAWAAAMGNRLAALALIARLKERHAEQVWEAADREGTLAPEAIGRGQV